jgi:glycosyltransferase involved in cell wall biosynthesis
MDEDYDAWIGQYDTLEESNRQVIADHIVSFANPPVFSVVMPVYNTRPDLLRATIESVSVQLYPYWELCIADDASTTPLIPLLLSEAQIRDPRVKFVRRSVNGHISAATNSALALATGDYVAFLDHDDLLSERALYEFAAAVVAHPDTDILYSDQDQIDDDGRRSNPFFKPDWDPDLLLGQNYVNHLVAYRRTILESLGGLRPGFDGSQDYDLILRASRQTEQIRHIPSVLYHWRRGVRAAASFSETWLDQCIDAAHRAVHDHLAELGTPGVVEAAPRAPMWNRVRFEIPAPAPSVSVVIPTRDRPDLLERCLDGLLRRTRYQPTEILILDNDSREVSTQQLLDRITQVYDHVRVIPFPGPFNYSAMNNAALQAVTGEIVVLLNSDIDVIDLDWLGEMVSHAIRPGVGLVGAKLLYGDCRVQHAGIVLGPGKSLVHVQRLASREDSGYVGQLVLTRTYSAVTAACLAARREVLLEIGGFDAINLPVAFSDVDLCLRAGDYGYRIVWTPFAELFHLEGASRGTDERPEHRDRMARELDHLYLTWKTVIENDPFHNPNLAFGWEETRIPAPPRHLRPWRRPAAL